MIATEEPTNVRKNVDRGGGELRVGCHGRMVYLYQLRGRRSREGFDHVHNI